MKRYEGSEIIGYRAAQFDEFLLPLAPPSQLSPPAYGKSLKAEGLVSRYTYLAPSGRSATELLRNYKLEFQRLGLTTLYEKGVADRGWFGPTLNEISDQDQIGQILAYNEAQERLLVGRSKDPKPTYYYVFVTVYKDGVIPERLNGMVQKDRAIAQLVVIAPEHMEEKMTFVNADEMSHSLSDAGKVALYGIYFDTDKDSIRGDSQPTLQEIAKLMTANLQLKLHIVGHTDNQGKPDYNLELSRRRAANVVRELTSKFGVAAGRLDSFGCGLYAPVASNESEEGRAKNRRVELVKW
ncbi:MAG: OmpA family protein [Acidobacteriia bacterium]|nr:OmpA family protein [Terriglobia bacterium]